MKMCPKCGCIMKDTDEVCPNCGHTENQSENISQNNSNGTQFSAPENPFENISLKTRKKKKESNLLNIPDEEDPFEKKQSKFSPNLDLELPKVKTPINNSTYSNESTKKGKFIDYSETSDKQKKQNESDNKNLLPIGLIALVVIGAIVFISNLISSNNTQKSNPTPDIKLSENKTPPEEPKEDPNNKIDEENEENKTPPEEIPDNMFETSLGKYTFRVSNEYVAVPYENNGLTLTNANLGITMTLMEGIYDLKTYRTMQEDLKKSMEENGTIVNKAYNTMISNHDLHIMELIEPNVSYIMAIVQIKSSENAILIMAADLNNSKEFNYEVLNEALKVTDTAKISK